jgi:O-antigen/teichoic acid export membrane protein
VQETRSQLKAGALLTYIQMGLQAAIALAYTPVMLRLVGQVQYGVYSMVASAVGYLGLFSFGFGSAYIRFFTIAVSKGPEETARLNGTFMIVFCALGTFAGLGGAILVINASSLLGDRFSAGDAGIARSLIALLVFTIVLNFPMTVFNSFLIAQEKFVFLKVLAIAQSLAGPLVALPALMAGYGTVGMVLASTSIAIVGSLIVCVHCVRRLHMRFLFRGIRMRDVRPIASFSFFMFLYMVVDQINWNVGKLVLGRMRGPRPVAVYGIASYIHLQYLNLGGVVGGIIAPRVNRLVVSGASDGELDSLFIRMGRIQFLVVSPVLVSIGVFGSAFLTLWAGPEYAAAYPILLILAIPSTLPLIQNVALEVCKAKNLHAFPAFAYLSVAVLNIVLSVFLTSLHGGIGTAFATAISVFVGNVIVVNIYYRVKVSLNVGGFYWELLRLVPSLLPGVVVGWLLVTFISQRTAVALLVSFVIFLTIHCLSLWLFAMDEGEKSMFSAPASWFFRSVKRIARTGPR